jgi:hypothetical protein
MSFEPTLPPLTAETSLYHTIKPYRVSKTFGQTVGRILPSQVLPTNGAAPPFPIRFRLHFAMSAARRSA